MNVIGDVLYDYIILSSNNIIIVWVVNSRASFHATPNRKPFHDFVQVASRHVRLGDGNLVKYMGWVRFFINQ